MRRMMAVGVMALFGAGGVGCATSATEARRDAEIHRVRAEQASRMGDFQTASREQRRALESEREAADASIDDLESGKTPPPVPQQFPTAGQQQRLEWQTAQPYGVQGTTQFPSQSQYPYQQQYQPYPSQQYQGQPYAPQYQQGQPYAPQYQQGQPQRPYTTQPIPEEND